ncbi:MAG: SGNH/GDSL hydrolase family protein [Janthinobacterium lividum]
MRIPAVLLAFAAVSLPYASAQTASQAKDWLPTWGTAAMVLDARSDAARNLPIGKEAVTLRQVVHISQGGKRVRVTFSNEFGTTPLRIDAAHLAFLSAGSKILTGTDRPLTFAGQPGITIAPGKTTSSDAVVERVPIFSDLVISALLPAQDLPAITYHAAAHTTTFLAPGDLVTAEQLLSPTGVSAPLADKAVVQSATKPIGSGTNQIGPALQTTSWYFLKNVEVDRTRKSAAVVAFGDSITDGTGSTSETNRRWPDVLAPLLASGKKTGAFSIVNEGIGGNRILHEGAGPSAMDRFDREVLDVPNVRYVVMLEGINDIGNMHRAPADAITQQQLIDAYTTLVQRAHARGVKFIPGTILPYRGAKYFTEDGEQIRQNVNTFLRTSSLFDGVIDFDKATRDQNHPDQLLPKYDYGDHLHPSDEGYAAMGAAISLKLFRKK